jgi:4-amino-4-deoxy-L-arabinose transferase-like glycosyltransferase
MPLVVIFAYILANLLSLAKFPIFADEAIYIRWAQIAVANPQEYAFLPMLDGKPPLHVWFLIPFVSWVGDPLVGGRILSVLFGGFSAWIVGKIIREIRGDVFAQRTGVILALTMPYWLFHARMALAEMMVMFLFTLSFYAATKIFRSQQRALWVIVFSLVYGAALWTKTTSLFLIGVFTLIPALMAYTAKPSATFREIVQVYFSKQTFLLSCAGFFAGLLFLSLKFSPLFPFLFTRSADYTLSFQEWIGGQWKYVFFGLIPKVLVWFLLYATAPVLLAAIRLTKKHFVLLLMSLVYMAPIILIGKVVTARYLFAAVLPLTVMAAIGWSELCQRGSRVLVGVLFTMYIVWSVIFATTFVVFPDYTPFSHEDRIQYLEEWSSGHGIAEVKERIKQLAEKGPVVIATEGYFGTLPDALQLQFSHEKTNYPVEIFGIGQPIFEIPISLRDRAKKGEDVYLVINSHRFLDTDESHGLVMERYPRPGKAPALLFIKVLK